MDVNDDAYFLIYRVDLKSIASGLAPTGSGADQAWTLRPYSADASCNHNHQ